METCNHPCQLIVGCYLIFELVTTWWTKEMFRAERKNSNDHDDSFTRIINSSREHDFFFSFLFFYWYHLIFTRTRIYLLISFVGKLFLLSIHFIRFFVLLFSYRISRSYSNNPTISLQHAGILEFIFAVVYMYKNMNKLLFIKIVETIIKEKGIHREILNERYD